MHEKRFCPVWQKRGIQMSCIHWKNSQDCFVNFVTRKGREPTNIFFSIQMQKVTRWGNYYMVLSAYCFFLSCSLSIIFTVSVRVYSWSDFWLKFNQFNSLSPTLEQQNKQKERNEHLQQSCVHPDGIVFKTLVPSFFRFWEIWPVAFPFPTILSWRWVNLSEEIETIIDNKWKLVTKQKVPESIRFEFLKLLSLSLSLSLSPANVCGYQCILLPLIAENNIYDYCMRTI